MNFEKTDLVDNFTLLIDVAGTLPLSTTFKLPILQNKDIKFLKLVSLTVAYDDSATLPVSSVFLIKSDIVTNSDRILSTFGLYQTNTGNAEAINVERSHILKCSTPLSGSFNIWLEGLRPAMAFDGTISLTFECYK